MLDLALNQGLRVTKRGPRPLQIYFWMIRDHPFGRVVLRCASDAYWIPKLSRRVRGGPEALEHFQPHVQFTFSVDHYYEANHGVLFVRQGCLRGCRNTGEVPLLPLPLLPKIERICSCGELGVSRRFPALDSGRRPHRTVCGYDREPGIPALLLPELRFADPQAEPESAVLGGAERTPGCGSWYDASGEYLLGGACPVVCVGRFDSEA